MIQQTIIKETAREHTGSNPDFRCRMLYSIRIINFKDI